MTLARCARTRRVLQRAARASSTFPVVRGGAPAVNVGVDVASPGAGAEVGIWKWQSNAVAVSERRVEMAMWRLGGSQGAAPEGMTPLEAALLENEDEATIRAFLRKETMLLLEMQHQLEIHQRNTAHLTNAIAGVSEKAAKGGLKIGANILGLPLLLYMNYLLYLWLHEAHGWFGGKKKKKERARTWSEWFFGTKPEAEHEEA